ncbi:MAG: hypothetical protein HC905_18205 [Bacteroidales bacterium]|nr:hypothetical protein [Bacteroidales bacterium]
MGIAVWDGESSCLPSTWEEALGNHPNNCKQASNAATFTAWNENGETQDVPYQDYFFPMKIKIIVVAVPQGATFSGWDNYLAEPNAPYTVDYANEKTNETVSSAWEYAGSTLGPWVAGASSKVNLTPGANKYFRKVIDPSYVKTLKVSARPAAPSVSVNFTNETTVSAIPTTMEYSTNSGMTGAIAGTGAVIPVTPGSALYFRNKATVSAFSSEIYSLNVAARPSAPLVGIDFINEKTDIAIPATMEYANNQDFTGSASGTATNLDIVPGSTLYFRNKATAIAFKSEIKTLVAPTRPVAPVYSVDFLNESTNVAVSASDEYASTSDMAGASAGSGTKLTLTPGNNIFLRTKASGTFFKSQVQELTVPVRPAAPTYTIDFANETTQQDVSSNDEYDTDASMLNAAAGQGSKIPVTPGSTFYFRKKATNLNFRSVNNTLTASSRPAAPLFTIDYSKVTTVENVPASVIYSKNSNFSSSNDGAGVPVALDPVQFCILSLRLPRMHMLPKCQH